MRLGKCHQEVDEQGIGKCSVPMWQNGCPAGFCDSPAYGRQTDWGRRMYDGYVPSLACPAHGGPKSRVYMDGNAWCAVKPDFVDLGESLAGFGDTPEEARKDLARQEAIVGS